MKGKNRQPGVSQYRLAPGLAVPSHLLVGRVHSGGRDDPPLCVYESFSESLLRFTFHFSPLTSHPLIFAVLSPKIVRFLENSPMPSFLCDFATLREIFLWLRLCRAKPLREIFA